MSKVVNKYSIVRKTLGEQWQALPDALQAHYQSEDNRDIGVLTIEYPGWMQSFLNILHPIGALLNRRGNDIPIVVEKSMSDDTQFWRRTVTFSQEEKVYFNSCWQYAGDNKLVEYVNPILGLCMSTSVVDETLYYRGEHFVLKLGRICIPIPEWMMLGHTTIIEQALGDNQFKMDFKLRHPVFGLIYRYHGVFTTSKV